MMSSVIGLSLVFISSVVGFAPTKFSTRCQNQLQMGGRSRAEAGLTEKVMFKSLRAKLNEAAKVPGFFEVGEGPAVSFHKI